MPDGMMTTDVFAGREPVEEPSVCVGADCKCHQPMSDPAEWSDWRSQLAVVERALNRRIVEGETRLAAYLARVVAAMTELAMSLDKAEAIWQTFVDSEVNQKQSGGAV